MKSLKGEQGLGLGVRTQKHSELSRDLDGHIQEPCVRYLLIM
jgi:hypothetical protein